MGTGYFSLSGLNGNHLISQILNKISELIVRAENVTETKISAFKYLEFILKCCVLVSLFNYCAKIR